MENVIFDINAGMNVNEIYLRYPLLQVPGDIHVGYSLDDIPEMSLINFNSKLVTIPTGNYTNVGNETIDGNNVYLFQSTDGSLLFPVAEKDFTKLVGTWGVDILSMKDRNSRIIPINNPYKEIFNIIDSANNKVEIYTKIIDKMLMDKNISIEDKQSILALD